MAWSASARIALASCALVPEKASASQVVRVQTSVSELSRVSSSPDGNANDRWSAGSDSSCPHVGDVVHRHEGNSPWTLSLT